MKKVIYLAIMAISTISCSTVKQMAIRLENDYLVTEKDCRYGYEYYTYPICDLSCEPVYYIKINNKWYVTDRETLNTYKVGDNIYKLKIR